MGRARVLLTGRVPQALIVVATVITLGLSACSEQSQSEKNTRGSSSTQSASPSTQPDPYAAEVKAWGEITDRFGHLRKYVQVAPGLKEDQLVKLATRLHQGEPETWFYLYDDDAKLQDLVDSLPDTAKSDLSDFPVDWSQEHLVAQLVLEIMPEEGSRYVVYRGSSSDLIGVVETLTE